MLRALTVGNELQSQALLRCIQLQYYCEVALWSAMQPIGIYVSIKGGNENSNLIRCEIVVSLLRVATQQTDEDEPSSHVQACEQMVLTFRHTPEKMKELVHRFSLEASNDADPRDLRLLWLNIERISSHADREEWCTDPPPKVMYVSEYEDKVDPYGLMLVQVYECSEPRHACCAHKWTDISNHYHKSFLGQRWSRRDRTKGLYKQWRFAAVQKSNDGLATEQFDQDSQAAQISDGSLATEESD